MKGDARKARRAQMRKNELFNRRKKAVEDLQREIKKFLGKKKNDQLIFLWGKNKAYAKIQEIRSRYQNKVK